jgi:ribosomal protein S18 acetylase RimI-like enzyme
LPAGWSWAALDGARADAAHAALAEIFRDAHGTSLMPVDDFRRAVVSGAAAWRVLLEGDRIAGLVRTRLEGTRGEVRILGRMPADRGRGLGPRLLAEALRVLREGGAGDFELSVETANERALDLYRRFGFEVVTRTPVFALALR